MSLNMEDDEVGEDSLTGKSSAFRQIEGSESPDTAYETGKTTEVADDVKEILLNSEHVATIGSLADEGFCSNDSEGIQETEEISDTNPSSLSSEFELINAESKSSELETEDHLEETAIEEEFGPTEELSINKTEEEIEDCFYQETEETSLEEETRGLEEEFANLVACATEEMLGLPSSIEKIIDVSRTELQDMESEIASTVAQITSEQEELSEVLSNLPEDKEMSSVSNNDELEKENYPPLTITLGDDISQERPTPAERGIYKATRVTINQEGTETKVVNVTTIDQQDDEPVSDSQEDSLVEDTVKKPEEETPNVSLKDIAGGLQAIEMERRRIIANQAVRSKRISNWVTQQQEQMLEVDEEVLEESQPSVQDTFVAVPAVVQEASASESPNDDSLTEVDNPTQGEPELSPEVNGICRPDSLDLKSSYNNDISDPPSADSLSPDLSPVNDKEINGHCEESQTNGWKDSSETNIQETLIDREIRLALEREEEVKRELEEAKNGIKLPINNQEISRKVVRMSSSEYIMQFENGIIQNGHGLNNNEEKNNSYETLIEREIRIQKEREETLAKERQVAQMAAQMKQQAPKVLTPKDSTTGHLTHSTANQNHSPPNNVTSANVITTAMPKEQNAESLIAREIRELKEREEELRQMRSRFSSTDNLLAENGPNNIHDVCSKELGYNDSDIHVNTNGYINGNGSVYSEEDSSLSAHHRTMSLDSLSSGGGGGSTGTPTNEFHVRRAVKVKPLIDEEDERPTYRFLNETPVEREIRLAKEREEELKKEKYIPDSKQLVSDSVVENGKKSPGQAQPLDLSNPQDHRTVQRKLATSRIQQEIEEQTQRENALKTAGTIRTTSEDHVDSKVTRLHSELAETFSLPIKLQSNASPQSLPSTPDSEPAEIHTSMTNLKLSSQMNGNASRNQSPTVNGSNRMFVKAISPFSPTSNGTAIRRPISGSGKGVMQKFIASRGKMMPTFTSTSKINQSPMSPLHAENRGIPSLSPREQLLNEIRAPANRTFKRTYSSAETKIQEELKQMKQREEELKLTRAKMFAVSQPDLLSIIDSTNGMDYTDGFNGLRERASSNPNLLDDSASDISDSQVSMKAVRRQSALIAQWEEKIQQNSEN